jgi:hypothetical protein
VPEHCSAMKTSADGFSSATSGRLSGTVLANAAPQPLPSAEEVIAGRHGDVLIKNTVLKADHFPSAC